MLASYSAEYTRRGLLRHVRTLLVLVLLAATAAAFVVTEDLKLEPDPLARPRVDSSFSPTCDCEQQTGRIGFRLRRADVVTLTIADESGEVVRTILDKASFRPGNHQFGWDGLDQTGQLVPEGRYRPRVELQKLGRLIEFSKQMTVDTTAPRVRVVNVSRRVVSPDGDGRGDSIRIRYRLSEPSHALLLVNGRRVWRTALRSEGTIPWRPKQRRQGLERLQVAAVDAAGNRAAGRPFYVFVRYLEVSPSRLRVRPRRLITVRVSTDYPRYTWQLGRRRASARTHTLKVRAPATPGRYALVIRAGGRRDSVSVLVRRR
jgi:FlgD Ig-like domain